MVNLNKIFVLSLTFLFLFSSNAFAATNKETLISDMSSLKTKINTLKSDRVTSLEKVVTDLSTSFDTAVSDLGYKSGDVEYLVSLGKISTNFKSDLITEQATIKTDLNSDLSTQLSNLDSLKDNISYNYTSITDSQKVAFSSQISDIDTNSTNIGDTYSTKIDKLKTKYTTSLTSYKTNLKSAFEGNKTSISQISNFDKKFQDLYSLVLTFQTSYDTFKTLYLSYAGELSTFSDEKQAYYVNLLKTELEKIRDKNIEANSSLSNYKPDIDRLIDLLLENFSNSLKLNISDSYGVLFSDTSDVDSILNSFTNLKNTYYDTDGLIKGTKVVSNSGATDEITSLKTKLNTINNSLNNLVGTDTGSSITISNVKVRLENAMVKYYNANYESYRQDLLTKIKEKLDVNNLEAKSVIIAADSIDLRYSLLNDKISKSNDITYINNQISDFKDSVNIYSYLNSSTLNKKIKKTNNNLDIYVINKEVALSKYKSYTKVGTAYEAQVTAILNKLETKYPDTYNEKLDTLVTRIDAVLNKNVGAKTRYTLLIIKKTIVSWQNNKIN